MEFRVLPFDAGLRKYLPQPNTPFSLIGRLVPTFDGESWTVREELSDRPGEKVYPEESYDPETYIASSKQAAFLALAGEECLGSIRLRARWNGDGLVEDLSVRPAYRGRGVGTALMDAAVAWCREMGLEGLTLETQDTNLLACRFYLRYGFVLGGIDARVYAHTPFWEETALYFYLSI